MAPVCGPSQRTATQAFISEETRRRPTAFGRVRGANGGPLRVEPSRRHWSLREGMREGEVPAERPQAGSLCHQSTSDRESECRGNHQHHLVSLTAWHCGAKGEPTCRQEARRGSEPFSRRRASLAAILSPSLLPMGQCLFRWAKGA